MGIPKFFRYISERYPCLTEKLKDHQIPEFDNLYLDVNGIIHSCSHPDEDILFRITEENIFKNIFCYLELLFRMIQPQKLFFIAIDGVAPRAKINNQRSRRFRSAKYAETQEAKLKAKGVILPEQPKFDSNCITPGTIFMAKLDDYLKYFISYKISTDKFWQKCKIIFSGSQVPGEGEHKIMDYIRYMKAQPDYDINTKHCLYGLDADLIMLGLCTHEIHFTLLREEVKFGKKRTKIFITPEETKFCLFHLSLLRDYINDEFSSLREKLPFPYDLEKIIDDWVLMGFLIGNDFIPHLPNLHIAHGALSVLYQVYMDVLPTLDGYLNETGTLRLDRFEKFMERLSRFDLLQFSEYYADIKYLESKIGNPLADTEKLNQLKKSDNNDKILFPKTVQDKEFDALLRSVAEMDIGRDEDEEEEDYETDSETYTMEFIQRKKDYYQNKLKYENVDEDFLRSQAEGYVRAIQWNLHYYYNGCCSWSWYYPHHYAPYISDIKDFKDLKLEFELGEPFLPFEQLLAALPPYSKTLLPSAFQTLLTEEQSPILNYYPVEFQTDLNGKKQDWEGVVLIPFIDEKSLLDAIAPRLDKLTPEEKARNKHVPMCLFTYTEEDLGVCKAPDYFPSIVKVFQRPSVLRTMILHIKSPPITTDLLTIGSKLLGNIVFVNWPHLKEAQVVGVSNCNVKLNFMNSELEQFYETYNEDEWNSLKTSITETYKERYGVEIGETKFLVHVRLLVGSKYVFGSHGKFHIEKLWSDTQTCYPYQTTVEGITVYSVSLPLYKSASDIFVPGSVCFMLGHPYYGAMGRVRESAVCEKSGRIKVSMITMVEPSLEALKKAQMEHQDQYMHGNIVSRRLGISRYLMNRITGSIFVKQTSDDSQQDYPMCNIGLNLKFNKRNEEIPGYTRKAEDGFWYYSFKTMDLIRSYMLKYPEVFEKLGLNSNISILQEEDLFKKGTGKLNEIAAWLKEQLQGIESRACGTETLDSAVMKTLEEEIDAYLKTANSIGKVVEMQVQPYLLYMPILRLRNLSPDPKTQTFLLDRICCTNDNFTVPLGYKGTVIGVQKAENVSDTMYDILFDHSFIGEFSTSGSSEFRTYRLSSVDFINISYGERLERKKVGTVDFSLETTDAWKNAPMESSASPKPPRIIQKSTDATNQKNQMVSAPKWKQYNSQNTINVQKPYKAVKNPQPNPNMQQNTQKKIEPTSEFQAIWNELHKKQVSLIYYTSVYEYNCMTSSSFSINPQDPSAFLKAMLKIPDGNAQQPTVQHPRTPKPPSNNTPPLVQQLFDYARQNEKVKDDKTPTWYCSQLLSYCQLSGAGMPRYSYFTNEKSNLIQAHILLPDKRIFAGDYCVNHEQAAGSAAKKVYIELKLANVMPHMKTLLPPPQHWYSSPQNSNWSQNIRPPMPQHFPPEPKHLQWFSEWVQKGHPNNGNYQQHLVKHNEQYKYNVQHRTVHNETKTEAKNYPTFVPLQAQKKSRDITAKRASNKDNANQCAKNNPQPVATQQKKELPIKTTKVEATNMIAEKQKSVQSSSHQQVQTTQNVVKPKKSRVAAKFCIPSQTEENNHNKGST
ncbi:5'-3' exoribonuclease 1 [Habropoda laboriosa]|uniref:5'-3' exoribonuclease 1 n=1 Tax=Habropoda laboriosa TaxID=597456 RepID=A0A0L7QSP1_9HYME|nr:5'-3' exoribonuclease 1 [Habropoda laboriosa]